MSITRDDWLHALNDALNLPAGSGLTSSELCARTGMGIDTVMRRLKLLQQQQKLVVERGFRPAIDGVMRHVPLYRLKESQ